MKKSIFWYLAFFLLCFTMVACNEEETSVIESTTQTTSPGESTVVSFGSGTYWLVAEINGKVGLFDQAGNTILPVEYNNIDTDFSSGLLRVQDANKKWGYIDKNAQFVIAPQFENAYVFGDNGIAGVQQNGKWGYIDTTGNYFIQPQFENVWNFSEGDLALVQQDGKLGYINKTGAFVIDPQFDKVLADTCVASALQSEESSTDPLHQATEPEATEPEVTEPATSETEKATVADPQSTTQTPTHSTGKDLATGPVTLPLGHLSFSSEGFRYFAGNGLTAACVDGKWGYIDIAGSIVIQPKFDGAGSFSENGLAPYRKDDKWGYIDTTGKTVIEPQFENAWPFSENGLACILKDGKWGSIDTTGKIVIQPQFDYIFSFNEYGWASVVIDGQHGYINTTGNMVLFPYANSLKFLETGLVIYKKDGKWGLIDVSGKIVIQPQFDYYRYDPRTNLIMVEANDKYGVLDTCGNYIIPLSFDNRSFYFLVE